MHLLLNGRAKKQLIRPKEDYSTKKTAFLLPWNNHTENCKLEPFYVQKIAPIKLRIYTSYTFYTVYIAICIILFALWSDYSFTHIFIVTNSMECAPDISLENSCDDDVILCTKRTSHQCTQKLNMSSSKLTEYNSVLWEMHNRIKNNIMPNAVNNVYKLMAER